MISISRPKQAERLRKISELAVELYGKNNVIQGYELFYLNESNKGNMIE